MNQVAKWEIMELELVSGKEFRNPFTEVELRAVFRHESCVLDVDGFYDGRLSGKNVWRVRFAPMHEGQWSYKIISNLAGLDGQTGTFECTQAVSRGGLTVNPHFANWFAREDGSAQMIINEGWYPHPGNGRQLSHEDVDFPQPSEEDMKAYFQVLSDHRVNMVVDIAQLYARQSSVSDPTFRWPWKVVDAENNKFDKDFFNLGYYQRLDRTMQFARERGIFFAMELLYDNSVVRPLEWSHHPLNKANGGWLEGNENGTGWGVMFDLDNREHMLYMDRYLRYTVARFAAYWNVCWSIGSEIGNLIRLPHERLPFALFPADKAARWYNYWGDFIARRDPYGRLRSFGDTGRQPLFVCTAHNNFIITQDPRNYPKDDVAEYYKAMNAFGEEFWSFGRPTVIGEMTAGTNNHYDMERRLYWIGFTSGYVMGRADRHFGPVIAGKLVESEKFNTPGIPPIYADMRRMAEFVENRDVRFWRMRPSDDLIDAHGSLIYCLAAKDEEYVVYFVNGGKATLEMPASSYEWFDPRTGEIASAERVESGTHTLEAPDGDDWVLHIVTDKRA
jgi:hypothetical protein